MAPSDERRAKTHRSFDPREAAAMLSSKTSALAVALIPASAPVATQAAAIHVTIRFTCPSSKSPSAVPSQGSAEIWSTAPFPRELAHEAGDEARVVAQIAPPQPPRLLRQPERPLHAVALEPGRRLRD